MRKLSLFVLSVLLILPYAFTSMHHVEAIQLNEVSLDPSIEKVFEKSEVAQLIVSFHGDGAPKLEHLNLLESIGVEAGVVMQSLPIVGVIATKAQFESLAKEEEIRSIYLNERLQYYNQDSTEITGVDKARTEESFIKANGGFPFSGKGVGVVINDSGVDGTHKDHELGRNLIQNVMGSTNLNALAPGLLPITYTENIQNTDTNSGHGTHVAGTVGGTGAMSGGKYEGVAPGANMIGYGSGAALLILDGIGGFDYAITHQHQYGIRVITNSWGSSGDFDPNHPINIASKKAYDRGITVLFAAGNEGPGENTHNPYAKAPWVISVAAGVKDGKLADFSSRGTNGQGGNFELDGKAWTWKDEPTITAPGVDIISTRVIAPVSSLAIDQDAETIEPAYLPYYTTMSGTSMATPHVAGIVALLLEANNELSPSEIKQVLQETATNMPGYESWEVGAGYVNAYAAIDQVINSKSYGKTVNVFQTFNSNADGAVSTMDFSIDFNPITLVSVNQYTFQVEEGLTNLTAKIDAKGVLEQTGNPLNLVLLSPDGTEYSSGVNLLFPLYTDRTVSVNSPRAGEWKAEIRGLRGNDLNEIGLGLPETVQGSLSFSKISGFSGLNDIEGHPAAASIKIGVKERLFDGLSNGLFKPDQLLLRKDLARYLLMGGEIRQYLPDNGTKSFPDVNNEDLAFVEAASRKGGAFKDTLQQQSGVIRARANGTFAPKDGVTRAELAYSLVQTLGLQKEAENFQGEVTVQYKDERVPLADSNEIPKELKGYVQLALDLNILNASFSVEQGLYDLVPTVSATFSPDKKQTRGDFAVAMTRFYQAFMQ